jgi:hypothetical protein
LTDPSCDDVRLAFSYCDRTLQLLLRTFFDIIRLRKGPEDVPDSPVVLLFACGLFALAMLVSGMLVQPQSNDSIYLSVAVSVAGYGLYWIVLSATGFTRRFLPTVSSIMACGSILTVLMVVAFLALNPVLGTNTAAIIAWLILIWSVPVKGHIIARAIGQHWYIGIAIALAIFIMQRFAYESLVANPVG